MSSIDPYQTNTEPHRIASAKLLLTTQLAINTHRLLCKRRQAYAMAQSFIRIMHVVIADGGVARHSVVPDTHGTIVPFDAHLQVSRHRDMLRLELLSVLGYLEVDSGSYLEQELEKRVGLLVFQANDAACEAWVDVQGFLAGRLGRVSQMAGRRGHFDDYGTWESSLRGARARSDGCSSPALCERTCRLASRSQLV